MNSDELKNKSDLEKISELPLSATAESVATRPKPSATARSISVTVLFFDVVGYTKHPVTKQAELKKRFNQLLGECLNELAVSERIILDTGDGAAVGFLQHPEEALEVAMHFRGAIAANQHADYPELKVRIGIHMGPINVVRDMNGQNNMVGDGINDAQRVMSFAGSEEIYVSRTYYEFISRLSHEFDNLFVYRGSQQDKHGREHPVYEVIDQVAKKLAESSLKSGASTIKLEPFTFEMPTQQQAAKIIEPVEVEETLEPKIEVSTLLSDIRKLVDEEEALPPKVAVEPAIAIVNTAESEMPVAVFEPAKTVSEPVKPLETPIQAEKIDAIKPPVEPVKVGRVIKPQAVPTKTTSRTVAAPAKKLGFPWLKIVIALLLLGVVIIFALPFVLPLRDYANAIENRLSVQLQQPVRIAQVSARLFPAPSLLLNDVTLGNSGQLLIKRATVQYEWLAFFSDNKAIKNIQLESAQINAIALPQLANWTQKVAADTRYPVQKIEMKSAILQSPNFKLSDLDAILNFDQSGKLSQANWTAEGGKYALEMTPLSADKLRVGIKVKNAALPLLPNWVFDELTAKGEMTSGKLQLTEIDGRMLDGSLLGNVQLDWHAGWSMRGDLVAKAVTLQKLNIGVEGDLEGSARFAMQASELSQLSANSVMNGRFTIRNGQIMGIDIVETVRQRRAGKIPGGRTHFESLSSDLAFSAGSYHFRGIRLDGGKLKASASVDVNKREVTGAITADLNQIANMGTAQLQLGGSINELTLR